MKEALRQNAFTKIKWQLEKKKKKELNGREEINQYMDMFLNYDSYMDMFDLREDRICVTEVSRAHHVFYCVSRLPKVDYF